MQLYLVIFTAAMYETGTRATTVVLVLFALKLGAQPLAVGLLVAMFSMFPMLVSVQTGKLANQYGTRWLLIFASTMGVLGMLIAFLVQDSLSLFIPASLVGLQSANYNVPLQNVVGQLSDPRNRTKNFSNYSLTGPAGNLAGPLFAGYSIDHMGYGNTCFVLAILSLAPMIIIGIWGGMLPNGSKTDL